MGRHNRHGAMTVAAAIRNEAESATQQLANGGFREFRHRNPPWRRHGHNLTTLIFKNKTTPFFYFFNFLPSRLAATHGLYSVMALMGFICDLQSLTPFREDLYLARWSSSPDHAWVLKAGVWCLTKAFAPLYDKSPLNKKITEIFGVICLADTLTNVFIPAYDMNYLHPVIFSTQQAKRMKSDIQLADVIMSTAAAPYFFPPHEFVGDGKRYSVVDGGVAANNPTMFAIHEAARMSENHTTLDSPDYSKFLVLSLGTGSAKPYGHEIGFGGPLDWFNVEKGLPTLIDVLFRASVDMVDMCTALVLGHNNSMHNFLQIQDYTLDPNQIKLNDASKDNVDALERIARDLLGRPITLVNPLTGLQEMPMDGRVPTDREAITHFARRLSAERRRRA